MCRVLPRWLAKGKRPRNIARSTAPSVGPNQPRENMVTHPTMDRRGYQWTSEANPMLATSGSHEIEEEEEVGGRGEIDGGARRIRVLFPPVGPHHR